MGRTASYGIVAASAMAWLVSNIAQPGTGIPVAALVWNFAVNVTSFALLLAGAGEQEWLGVLDRPRSELAALAQGNAWPVSFSIGMVTCPTSPCGADELVRRAGDLMYEVKAAGKNGLRHVVLGHPAD